MPLTLVTVFQRALPIILANASVPLLSLADTAMLGYFGTTTDLAALAVVSVLFNLIFWSFGFLRMSTTGLIAQSQGQDGSDQRTHIVWRALVLAQICSISLLIFSWPLREISFGFFSLAETTETPAREYFNIRIWCAPATLCYYCLCGILIGLGKSRWLLFFQVALNFLNIFLNFIFVYIFGLGVDGLALGTVISETLLVLISAVLINKYILPLWFGRDNSPSWQTVFKASKIKLLLSLNRDIFLRTLFLLLSFLWFTRQAAEMGNTVIAANQLLLAIISFTAFFLDGFAFVAEAEVGKQFGKGDVAGFRRAVNITSQAAAFTAIVFSIILFFYGSGVISLLTNIEPVKEVAISFMPYTAVYIAISFAAFQLDGIFIGTTQGPALRNASLFSFAGFIASYHLLTYIEAYNGLWLSFISYIFLRAVSLACYYPSLLKTCKLNSAAELPCE